MSKIYVAWNPILVGADLRYNKHSYLVKDNDGNLATTNDQFIIRGSAERNSFYEVAFGGFDPGKLLVQPGVASDQSADGLDNPDPLASDKNGDEKKDTAAERHYTEITVPAGETADSLWTKMTQFATSLGNAAYDYSILQINCQATTTSVLAAVGVDFEQNVPTGSTFSQWVSANILLSGSAGDVMQGFGGDDFIFDRGGSDTFYGGNISANVRNSDDDGLDTVIYDGNTNYNISVFNNNRIVTDRTGGSYTDLLYSIEEVVFKNHNVLNILDYSSFGNQITVQTIDSAALKAQQAFTGGQLQNGIVVSEDIGENFHAYNIGKIVGTGSNDTFTMGSGAGLAIDGGGGSDTLTVNGNYSLIQGGALRVSNVETINIAPDKNGYFIIEKMGNTFHEYLGTSGGTSTFPYLFATTYTTLSYKNYTSPITVNFDVIGYDQKKQTFINDQSGSIDRFDKMVSVIGTDLGDTFILRPSSYLLGTYAGNNGVHYGVPVFSGAGNDTFYMYSAQYHKPQPIIYGGGHDVFNPNAVRMNYSNLFVPIMPLGVKVSDISYEVVNIRTSSGRTESDIAWFERLADVRVNIANYGTMTFKNALYQAYDENTDPSEQITLGGPVAFVQTESGVVRLSFEKTFSATAFIPSSFDLKITPISDPDAQYINTIFFKNSYQGTFGVDNFNLNVFNAYNNFNAYDGDDVITGSSVANIVYGGGGDDKFTGNGGDDLFYGGEGIDTAIFNSSYASYTVANAASYMIVTNTAGTEGKDQLYDVEIVKFLDGVYQNGTFSPSSPVITYNPSTGNDTINASAATAAVTINLLAGNDAFTGSNFNDNVTAGDGNDTVEGRGGNDVMSGGNGTDTVTYASATAAVTVNLATTTAQNTGGAGTDTISTFENLTGSAFNDTLTGDANANVINGGDGNDAVQGEAGNDTLNGGNGVDTLRYNNAAAAVTINLTTTTAQNTVGAGTDTITGFENLTGSAYNDTLTGNASANVIEGLAGNDIMNGGAGVDTLNYTSATAAVTVNLATTAAQNTVGAGTDMISAFENLTGSGYNDTLTGDANANTIKGGAGNDTIQGGAGNDILDGEAGTDTVTYAAATAAVTVNLATTTSQATGGAGSDTITNFEHLTGSGYNDTLRGNTSNNTITGGNGNDIMYGNSGNDLLYGGAGTDTLYGDAGNDTLNGGASNDVLYGGAGSDIFKFSSGGGIDTIKDFKTSETDKIDIKDLLTGYDPVTKAITDFIQITTSGTSSIVKIDANGLTGGTAWTQIATLENITGLTDEAALKAAGTIIA